jgi:hypothetical protein
MPARAYRSPAPTASAQVKEVPFCSTCLIAFERFTLRFMANRQFLCGQAVWVGWYTARLCRIRHHRKK